MGRTVSGRTDLPETDGRDPPSCQERDAAINVDENRKCWLDDDR